MQLFATGNIRERRKEVTEEFCSCALQIAQISMEEVGARTSSVERFDSDTLT